MNIIFITHGDRSKASSRVRAFWIGEELSKQGEHCDYISPQSRWATLACGIRLVKYDVIIFQKTYRRYHHWLLKAARVLGKQTFIDIDDAPSLTNAEHTLRRVASMMREATGVFVGSRNLLDYASQYNSNTHLIPSCIKLENYPLKDFWHKSQKDPICLGWIGNGGYYAEDLISILTEPLQGLARRHSLKLKIVGACGNQGLQEAFGNIAGLEYEGIDSIDWSNPEAVIEQIHSFDIGLYPLIENEFNRYKCGFKALEYMACGLPVVSSQVAINAEIIENGKTGFLADSCDAWVSSLETMIQSQDQREQMGAHGRQVVEESYSTSRAASMMREQIPCKKWSTNRWASR